MESSSAYYKTRVYTYYVIYFDFLKTKWQSLPLKYRILGLITIFLVSSACLLAVLKTRPGLLPGQPQPSLSQVPEGFEKLVIPERQPAFFKLHATAPTKYGILPNQAFTMETRQAVEASWLRQYLKSSAPLTIIPVSPTEFTLYPATPLGIDQVLKLSLPVEGLSQSDTMFDRNYSWTFQTQGKFQVTGSVPGDQKTDVPQNTGIEIVFSQDDYQDPDRFITISPAVEFRTERHAETFSIIPLKPLAPKTIYTVTLKPGLNLKSRSDPLTAAYSFTFQTTQPITLTQKPTYNLSLRDSFVQFSPATPPTVKVYTSNWNDYPVTTTIYQFPSAASFLSSRSDTDSASGSWWHYYPEDKPVDTSGLSKIASVELKLQQQDQLQYLQLPEALPTGYYLIQFRYQDGEKLEQLWLQSTSVSGFVSAGRNQTLVWANDVQSGLPVGGATVRFSGSSYQSYTSDAGLAVFSTPQLLHESRVHYLEIASPSGSQVFLPISALAGQPKSEISTPDDYWSYLYQERRLYKPSDVVYFWGIIKLRDTNTSPGNVTVRLVKNYSSDQILQSTVVPVAADGSFFNRFDFSDLPASWYRLEVWDGNTRVTSSGFQVASFEKPEMKIEVSVGKKAIFTTESVPYTARVSFFDGTPAKNIEIQIHEERTGKKTTATTNSQGEITYTYSPTYISARDYPRYESVTFTPSLAQNQLTEGYGSVYVYGSRLQFSGSGSQAGNRATVKSTLRNVNLTGVNSGASPEVLSTPAATTEVSMIITKTWYERHEEGTYYDFIEKVTRPAYRYESKKEAFPVQKLTTNSLGQIEYGFDLEKDRSYEVYLEAKDKEGKPTQTSQYYYYYDGFVPTQSQSQPTPEITLDRKENLYSLGESVNASIELSHKPYPVTDKNRFLFIVARHGHQDYYIETDPKLSFVFESKHVPNSTIGAIIFTGSSYQRVSGGCTWDWNCNYDYASTYFAGVQLRYRTDDSQTDLEISADKSKYLPGDTASVTVAVTKNGQPLTDTEVNLVLVDEALAAIGGVVTPSPLTSLYQPVPDYIYYVYSTHKPLLPDMPQAEKGGGGGGYREIFKDTSFFGRAKTDSSGKASFSVILPDNLTTWLVYAQSVDSKLQAGFGHNRLVVTKDFFVTSNFPKSVLSSDRPQLAASGFGSALTDSSQVKYQADFFSGQKNLSHQDKSQAAFKQVGFDFPKLVPGEYQAGLKGQLGDLSDGLRLPFSVVDSRISLATSKKYSLVSGQEAAKLELAGHQDSLPIRLVISDAGKGKYFYPLENYCYPYGNRLERFVAKSRAAQILATRFPGSTCPQVDSAAKLTSFQDFDGGLSQVSWGSSHLETTVWAIFVDSSGFDKARLVAYLEKVANQPSPGTISEIYSSWGLTLLGEPRINKLLTLADSASGFEDRALSALALASIGEIEKARDLYYDLLADYAYTSKPYIRIQRDTSSGTSVTDKYLKDTSLMLLIGSLVQKDYNLGLYSYLRDYRVAADDIVLDLAHIAFIDEEISTLPDTDTEVSLVSSSFSTTYNLSRGSATTVKLLPSEVGDTRLIALSGKAEATAYYTIGKSGLEALSPDNRLSLKRTIKKVKGTGPLTTGDIVEIRLDYDATSQAPLGEYSLIDPLPSGLIYLSQPYNYGLKPLGWSCRQDDNVITSCFWNSLWWQTHKDTVRTYYARVATPGTFIYEPAVIQSRLDLSVVNFTPQDTLKIDLVD